MISYPCQATWKDREKMHYKKDKRIKKSDGRFKLNIHKMTISGNNVQIQPSYIQFS